jgi:riboflavin transporter FmnP
MEYLLLILSLIFIILGYVGAFVPGLSGPPLAWVAILLSYFVTNIQLPLWVVIVTGVIAGLSLLLEWIIPAYGTKIFNGSKYGVRGSYVGMIYRTHTIRIFNWTILRRFYWRTLYGSQRPRQGVKSSIWNLYWVSARNTNELRIGEFDVLGLGVLCNWVVGCIALILG